MITYQKPDVSFLVLDYKKPGETRLLLESLKRVKFPYKVIYLHNGNSETYPYDLFREGLVDQLIQTRDNNGLGVGTRDLFAASFSPYSIYVQNDQILGRDFMQEELDMMIDKIETIEDNEVKSVSLAGDQCQGKYSERAHLIETSFYKDMERGEYSMGYGDHCKNTMPNGGAGPYHHDQWREGSIQEMYLGEGFVHYIWPRPLFIDNGRKATRQNPDGSVWEHEPDTKSLRLISGPVKERYVYPKLNDEEWASVLSTQSWPEGKIPANEVKDSFVVPQWH